MTNISAAGTILIGDMKVHRLGLGTNRITDDEASHELLQKAVKLGIDFIDTAHVYSGGESEISIGNALAPYGHGLVVATKGGLVRHEGRDGASPDNTAELLRQDLEDSLQRLETDHIDVWQLHRVNPEANLYDTMRILKGFQDEGLVRHIGLSEVSVEQLEQALSVVPIVSVQNEYNVSIRKSEALVDFCEAHSIVFIPWFPLGGLYGDGPQAVQDKLSGLTEKYHATTYQLALAWLLRRSPQIMPIPGTLSIDHLKANIEAAAIELDEADYQMLTES